MAKFQGVAEYGAERHSATRANAQHPGFGTSGIRGIVGKEITVDLAIRVGRAVAEVIGSRVVIARDTRKSGEMLEAALASGVLATGGEAVRIGIAPTPTLALSVPVHGDAGVMVTASHNPSEYNGFKLFDKNGEEIPRDVEKRVESLLSVEKPRFATWDKLKADRRVSDALRRHVDKALANVDAELIRVRRPKVVVDCGNGAASVIMPYALREAGCRVVSLNCDTSGSFSRGLEPNHENLEELRKIVPAIGADLGIAHDGDGDRAIIVDEKGELLGLDAQLALMCSDALKRKRGVVVTTVEASLAVREAVERGGGKLAVTPVGSLHVKNELKKVQGVFGGEPCGEYIFPESFFCPDGILSGLRFVELFCKRGKLGEQAKKVKIYPMHRAKFPCKDKEKAMGKIAPKLKKAFKGKVWSNDGIRIDMPAGWLLVRASGTEPIIRLTAEHKSEAELRKMVKKAEALIKAGVR